MINLPASKNTNANMSKLAARIKELEAQEAVQQEDLKQQAVELFEELKPSALLKSALHEITASSTLKHSVVDTSLAVGAGWLARKAFTFNSKNIFRKLLGYGLQYITTNVVSEKMPGLRNKIKAEEI